MIAHECLFVVVQQSQGKTFCPRLTILESLLKALLCLLGNVCLGASSSAKLQQQAEQDKSTENYDRTKEIHSLVTMIFSDDETKDVPHEKEVKRGVGNSQKKRNRNKKTCQHGYTSCLAVYFRMVCMCMMRDIFV